MFIVAICDESQEYLDGLENLIFDVHPNNIEVRKYRTAEAFLAESGIMHHLAFINVRFPEINGEHIAEKYRRFNLTGVIILLSSSEMVPIRMIKFSPYGYLLKEYKITKIKKELVDIFGYLEAGVHERAITVKCNGDIIQVKVADISYISKLKYGSQIHVVKEKRPDLADYDLITRLHLKDFYKELNKMGFEYAHGSYLVNCRWVERLNQSKFVILKDNVELNVSRARLLQFRKMFIEYWGNKYKKV